MLASNSKTKLILAVIIATFALNSSYLIANVCEQDALKKINNNAINSCNKKTWGDHEGNVKCFQKHKVNNACANCFADLSECAYNNCVGFGSPCGFKGTKRK